MDNLAKQIPNKELLQAIDVYIHQNVYGQLTKALVQMIEELELRLNTDPEFNIEGYENLLKVIGLDANRCGTKCGTEP
jgi:hypothetical protein